MKKNIFITLIIAIFVLNTILITGVIATNELENDDKETNNIAQNEEINNKKEIENGTYRISLFGNSYCHKVLEIENGSTEVTANVQIGTWFNKDNEKNKFKVTYDEESGYYEIQSVKSGKMLDVQNGGMISGTNVWQHNQNGTDAQKWKIQKNTDGSYNIISKKNGLYLNVENLKNGENNVTVSSGNSSEEQKFQFMSLDKIEEEVTEDGVYQIQTAEDSNKVVEVKDASNVNGANIQVGSLANTASKKFQLTYNKDDGYYTIKSISSGKVLDAQNGGMTAGTNVWQYDGNYSDAQRWKIEKNADGTYSFICKKSGLYLNVKNSNIELANKMGNISQKFNIISVKDEKPEKTVEEGTYRISLYGNSNCHMALEIENGSKEVTANVQVGIWVNKNNERNKFKLLYDKDTGYYEIESINSGKLLDVQNGGMTSGTNVWQHGRNGTDAQKWKIEKNLDGSYSIISKKNGLYLNVQNFSGGGRNITVNEGNGREEQKFQFIGLDKIEEQVIEDGIYKIQTGEDSNKVIEVKEASFNNGGNIQVGNWQNVGSKKFQLTYNKDDGYYTIKGISSRKVWDAQNGGMTAGTNVWQYDGNYTDAQRWKIEKNTDGTYSFICKKSGLYLNVKNSNIELANKTGNISQKFYLSKIEEENPDVKIKEGTYKIVVASREDLAIDVKDGLREVTANIQLGKSTDTIRNEFNIKEDGNGYYIISSVNSGNVLDVQNGGMTTGTNVWQHGNNGTDAQKWIIEKNADGSYGIISKKNGLYLDVQNGNMSNGANIWMCIGNGTNAQKFKLIEQESKTEKYIEDGLYKVLTKTNSTIGFDIESANKNNGGIFQIWQYQGVSQQQFNITYNNGYYFIVNVNSNKAMQAVEGRILQYDTNYNNDNQKWILKQVEGYYCFISKATQRCVTIPNGSIINGIDLLEENDAGADKQLFKIENAGIYINESKYPGIKQKIDNLQMKYPNWKFELLYTGVNFYDAVDGEYYTKRNCLVDTSTYRGEWIASNPYHSGVWYSASYKGIEYFMDVRNFLNDVDVFQFLELNGYNQETITYNQIQEQVKNSFLQNYVDAICNACRNQNVNPYYVIARLFQEQSRKGTTIGTGMDGGDGNTYYNPFNIGAEVGNDYNTALKTAKDRGWNSMEKAIYGGIDFLKANWLENYQNTLYQNKFDIDTRNGTSLFAHEYMQNLSAAYSEARMLRSCYTSSQINNSSFTFIIPIYENMPYDISSKPTNSTDPVSTNSGPKDVQVVNISSFLRLRDGASTDSNVLAELQNGTHLLSIKRAVNGNWHQVVTDDGKIGYVSGDYVSIISDQLNCNTRKVVKTADGIGIKIRIGPSINVDQAGTLSDGTTVTVISTGIYNIDGYDWDRVVLSDGRQVFAPAKYLK